MLFHGSSKFITNQIKPHISFHYKPYVYATSDYYYALVRAGKFNTEKFLIKEDYYGNDKKFTLVELQPGAFIETFYTDGYIYLIDDNFFEHNKDCMENEYISKVDCDIKHTVCIGNVWKEILNNQDKYNLIFYGQDDEYWKTVRGGKEGYLERRKERLRKVQEQ